MLIAAQGDSWFDYPGTDVLSALELGCGVSVASCAHRGDTLESMAYDDSQGRKLARLFSGLKAAGRTPDAVLVSAGGNDIAGDELAMMLNHASSGLDAVNERVVEGVMDRLEAAYRTLLFGVTGLSRHFFRRPLPIVIHGYGNAIPDGRGFMGGAGILPGPWLRPAFERKGHDHATACEIMRRLIEEFARMQERVIATTGLSHVHRADVRLVLMTEPPRNLAPQHWHRLWADELHPTVTGFNLVAAEIYSVLCGAV